MWTVSIGQVSNVQPSFATLVVDVLEDALEYWSRYVAFDTGVIDVKVNIVSLGETTLARASTTFSDVSAGLLQADTILELQTGRDQNGAEADVDIDVNADSINANEFYYGGLDDPPPPSGQWDLFTILVHEIAHGLGFLSLRDTGDRAIFDTLVTEAGSFRYFIGNNAQNAFGGVVPLNLSSTHLDDSAGAYLMTATVASGERQFLSATEVAILADVGLPVRRPTSVADTLYGFDRADDISLGGGDDLYFALAGDDSVRGGAGNDTIFGGIGADTIDGGGGADRASYADASIGIAVDLAAGTDGAGGRLISIEEVEGSDFGDSIGGSSAGELILGGAGADTVIGLAGDDRLDGGDGDDQIFGGFGDDRLIGGAGADFARSGPGNDTLLGGAGADTLGASNRTDLLRGGDGDDFLLGSNGNDRLFGENDDDLLLGGNGRDTLYGGAGADRMVGGAGRDTASYAYAESSVYVRLWAGEGLSGDAAGDALLGIENLQGSPFSDTLAGDGERNRIGGGFGDDLLLGAAGDDTLIGGPGADTMTGGAGDDAFVFQRGSGIDRIADLEPGSLTPDYVLLLGFGTAFDTFEEVMAAASPVGAGVLINFGAGDRLVIEGVALGDLEPGDFIFG